ncbi:hypothetical protein D9619_010516 [Psilocybe cf. subviscida]|uniref:Uncharacterized protein n=1 Tax=Psilocybe cf. subviscida TaxID=2480587 RepID=A0A8H5ERX7_9AGAR|nr:hypothetical protein D9619_010516 [Psilocybe cf. subviscida]
MPTHSSASTSISSTSGLGLPTAWLNHRRSALSTQPNPRNGTPSSPLPGESSAGTPAPTHNHQQECHDSRSSSSTIRSSSSNSVNSSGCHPSSSTSAPGTTPASAPDCLPQYSGTFRRFLFSMFVIDHQYTITSTLWHLAPSSPRPICSPPPCRWPTLNMPPHPIATHARPYQVLTP